MWQLLFWHRWEKLVGGSAAASLGRRAELIKGKLLYAHFTFASALEGQAAAAKVATMCAGSQLSMGKVDVVVPPPLPQQLSVLADSKSSQALP